MVGSRKSRPGFQICFVNTMGSVLSFGIDLDCRARNLWYLSRQPVKIDIVHTMILGKAQSSQLGHRCPLRCWHPHDRVQHKRIDHVLWHRSARTDAGGQANNRLTSAQDRLGTVGSAAVGKASSTFREIARSPPCPKLSVILWNGRPLHLDGSAPGVTRVASRLVD